jgi:hypothetical protein
MYTIDEARSSDLPLLPAIELAAAIPLADHAPASVLAETTSQAELPFPILHMRREAPSRTGAA